MIPYDSFLIDGPWLVCIGWILGKLVNRYVEDDGKNKKVRSLFSFITILMFYVTSISLYFNMEWTRWIWEMCGSESGRDWMINSGVFSFDHENVGTGGHVMAAFLFATYPVWLKAGFKLADRGKQE